MQPDLAVAAAYPDMIAPPVFDNAALAYGGALFATLAISVSAMSVISLLWHFHRIEKAHWRAPVSLCRLGIGFLMLAFVVEFTPDALFLLTWGEVERATSFNLLIVARLCDFLAFVPFAAGLAIIALSDKSVTYQLKRQPYPVDIWHEWTALSRPAIAMLITVGISAGVTLAK